MQLMRRKGFTALRLAKIEVALAHIIANVRVPQKIKGK